MVRSNEKGEVGFLSDTRRTNVAITRAKRHVCIVCDTNTMRNSKFLLRMIKYFQEIGLSKTADEYLD
jgi:ATP-dependent RNA/DNA helicase IGHMBP2